MKELQLTILEEEDLRSRYEQLKNTRMTRLTDEAVANGYSIAMLHYPGLKFDSGSKWVKYAENAIAARFKGQRYKIGAFTDLSEVDHDKLYFAFKTKEGVQIAHSLSGCDSEGFIYNC